MYNEYYFVPVLGEDLPYLLPSIVTFCVLLLSNFCKITRSKLFDLQK